MGVRVKRFEPTPNPNAKKAVLEGAISAGPRSFRSADEASGDALASALFGVEGVNNVLMNGDWVTIGKRDEAAWRGVERGVRDVLASAAGAGG